MPRPKRNRIRRNITLPRDVDRALRKYAREHKLELSEVVSRAVSFYTSLKLYEDRGSTPQAVIVPLAGPDTAQNG